MADSSCDLARIYAGDVGRCAAVRDRRSGRRECKRFGAGRCERHAPPTQRSRSALQLPETSYVDPATYAPILKTVREESNIRTAHIAGSGATARVVVHKLLDSGSYVYGGLLDGLLVNERAEEGFTITSGNPLSAVATSRYDSRLQRGSWDVRAVTATEVRAAGTPSHPEFRYRATIDAYSGGVPFAHREIEGRIPRRWV